MTAARGLLLVAAAGLVGCMHATPVERAYDGHVVQGRYVAPEAYAAFLRGAIDEAAGHRQEALREYGDAASIQPESPEVWTRIADVRCQVDPRDPGAEEALSHAIALEPAYAQAWAVRARCALARGDVATAQKAAGGAAQLDARADEANLIVARTAASPADASGRARLLALTATAHDPAVAWDALATWAAASGDVPLWARALRELARRVPAKRVPIARSAEQLAGIGELGEAWAVAAAAAGTGSEPLPEGTPLAARLALDEAIATHDAGTVRERATRVRVSLEEAAARALLGGERGIAQQLADEVSAADPDAWGARLVRAACAGGDLQALAEAARNAAPVSWSTWVAVGVALSRLSAGPRVQPVLRAIAHEGPTPGDDRTGRPAVALASMGVVDAGALTPDGRVELAALKGDASSLPGEEGLDARHVLLALAVRDPGGARTLEMAKRLARVAAVDAVVASAEALVQLGAGGAISPDAPRALLERNAADPLLAATALRLAERVGDRDVARRARQVLTALGRAPSAGAGVD